MCGTSIPPLLCEHISQDISCYENLDSTCCWVKMLFFLFPVEVVYLLNIYIYYGAEYGYLPLKRESFVIVS